MTGEFACNRCFFRSGRRKDFDHHISDFSPHFAGRNPIQSDVRPANEILKLFTFNRYKL
jgi:hypothetical protein